LQDQQSELTASEARETLKSQTRQLQDLYARMEHEQSLVEELKSQVAREEEHERKLEQQLKRANDQAAEAVRRLHLVDPEMEQEYRKLLVERQVFGVLTCIGNVTTGGGVLEITFTIAPDCTVKMKVLVHPETGKLLDADVLTLYDMTCASWTTVPVTSRMLWRSPVNATTSHGSLTRPMYCSSITTNNALINHSQS
jgi:outer membrane murein-binding lipoprotein Lpp